MNFCCPLRLTLLLTAQHPEFCHSPALTRKGTSQSSCFSQGLSVPRSALLERILPLRILPLRIVFVDGSYFRIETGDYHAIINAITNLNSPLQESPLPEGKLVQTTEFITLIRACQLAEDQRINAYTVSRYASGVVHAALERKRFSHFCWNPYQKWTTS